MRRAYSLKMAASLACARALKMISSGKFSMHENKPFALQLGAEFAAKMDGRCVICRVFNRLWLHPMILRKITASGQCGINQLGNRLCGKKTGAGSRQGKRKPAPHALDN